MVVRLVVGLAVVVCLVVVLLVVVLIVVGGVQFCTGRVVVGGVQFCTGCFVVVMTPWPAWFPSSHMSNSGGGGVTTGSGF